MAVRDWIRPGLLAALMASACAIVGAQAVGTGGGILTGKLTDLHSTPLSGAAVVVRNEQTGAEARGVTGKNGSFRFAGLEPGAYTVEAENGQLGRGRLAGVVVVAGHEAHVQAAMAFEAPGAHPALTVAGPARSEGGGTTVAGNESAAPKVTIVATTPAAMPRPAMTASATRTMASEPATDRAGNIAQEKGNAVEPARESPSAESSVPMGAVPAAPLQALAVRGGQLPTYDRAIPAAETPVLRASLASEPVASLNLSGLTTVESSVRSNVAALSGSLALSLAAASAAQGAMPPSSPPARVASAQADPVTEAVATVISGVQLQALPAAGRRWQDFVLDTPTASTPAGAAEGGSLRGSWRGAGQEQTTVDGVSTRTAFGGQQSPGPGAEGVGGRDQNAMGQAWAGGHGSPVAEAAIREVQTAAGDAETEGDRTTGGRVNVDTARGTNGLHGQGFWFDRQNTWGAQNPFTQWVTETSESEPLAPFNDTPFPVFDNFQDSPGQYGPPESYTPPDHEMVWGVGLGSQIRRDKLFWFGALDSYHRNDPGLSMRKWPYAWQIPSKCEPSSTCTPTLGGFFAPPSDDEAQVLSARLGLSSVNPVAEGLSAYSPMLTALDGLLGPAPRTAAQWVGFGRLDWNAAERHKFTLEGIGAHWNSPGGGLTGLSENYGNHSFGSSQASEEWLLGRWEAFMTPNLLAVTQGSMGRNILEARPSTPSSFEQMFLGPNAYGQLPQIVVDNRYGFTIGNPSRFGMGSYPDERLYEGQEAVSWVRGSLLVKAGFEVSHNFDATSLLRNQTGTYTYSNVENFASDALVFAKYGLAGELNPYDQHNCDQTGKVWVDSGGGLRGLGYLPCYSYYSQVTGPTNWNLSTNDWAAFWTAQWQPKKLLVVSGGLRWAREQLPPPLALLNNTALPLTEKLPSLGNDWGPRISLALGSLESHWPVLRLGYGMYYGRTENATIETALTQTGSPNGDQSIFMRPTDNLNAGGAPPFPYVLTGAPGSVVTPGAVEFAPNFRNPEVHQAVAAVEEELPSHVQVTASALMSLGRRLPVPIEANIDTNPADTGSITYAVCDETAPSSTGGACGNLGLGPIKATRIMVPFYASWPSSSESTGNCPTPFIGWLNPCYQGIDQITSKANSTYEAAMLKVVRYGRRGLSLHAHYTYSHAMDWNPGESPLDPNPAQFNQEYGTSGQDIRHSAAAMVVYEAPWKLHNLAGPLANGWMLSGIGQFHSGLPYSMRVSGSLPGCGGYAGSCTPPQSSPVNVTAGDFIAGLRPGMNGSGGDNRVYGMGNDGRLYDIGRNTYRYPATWKADMRLGKKFDLGQMRQLELLVESFNLFNHQNVTEIETTGYTLGSGTASSPPTLNFLTGLKINATTGLPNPAFGQPLNVNATNFYRERQIQVGVRMRF
jgi:hypothetical protein